MTRARQYKFNAFDSFSKSNESIVFFESEYAGSITNTKNGWLCEDGQLFEFYNDAYDHQAWLGRGYKLTRELEIA